MLLSKLQQQLEGVAIGGNGVRAGLSLADQTLGEKRFQEDRKVAIEFHDQASHLRSIRSLARPISSGQADRYQ
jgi:hypothetical protein